MGAGFEHTKLQTVIAHDLHLATVFYHPRACRMLWQQVKLEHMRTHMEQLRITARKLNMSTCRLRRQPPLEELASAPLHDTNAA